MRYEITKTSIQIIPETKLDEVFLEMVFELKQAGDIAIVKRVAPYGLPSSWAYAEVKRREE